MDVLPSYPAAARAGFAPGSAAVSISNSVARDGSAAEAITAYRIGFGRRREVSAASEKNTARPAGRRPA